MAHIHVLTAGHTPLIHPSYPPRLSQPTLASLPPSLLPPSPTSSQHGATTDVFSGTVEGQHVPYITPSENGGKADVRWMALRRGEGGAGVLLKSEKGAVFEVSGRLLLLLLVVSGVTSEKTDPTNCRSPSLSHVGVVNWYWCHTR